MVSKNAAKKRTEYFKRLVIASPESKKIAAEPITKKYWVIGRVNIAKLKNKPDKTNNLIRLLLIAKNKKRFSQ